MNNNQTAAHHKRMKRDSVDCPEVNSRWNWFKVRRWHDGTIAHEKVSSAKKQKYKRTYIHIYVQGNACIQGTYSNGK